MDKGTEAPFSGKYVFTRDKGVYKGVYRCMVCGNPLFSSYTKFNSGTGWPNFYEPISPNSVEYHEDNGLSMSKTEITCGKCGSHLGHVFEDGPKTLSCGRRATGKRYCINCISLDLKRN